MQLGRKSQLVCLLGLLLNKKTQMARRIGLAEADRLVTDRYCKGPDLFIWWAISVESNGV